MTCHLQCLDSLFVFMVNMKLRCLGFLWAPGPSSDYPKVKACQGIRRHLRRGVLVSPPFWSLGLQAQWGISKAAAISVISFNTVSCHDCGLGVSPGLHNMHILIPSHLSSFQEACSLRLFHSWMVGANFWDIKTQLDFSWFLFRIIYSFRIYCLIKLLNLWIADVFLFSSQCYLCILKLFLCIWFQSLSTITQIPNNSLLQ